MGHEEDVSEVPAHGPSEEHEGLGEVLHDEDQVELRIQRRDRSPDTGFVSRRAGLSGSVQRPDAYATVCTALETIVTSIVKDVGRKLDPSVRAKKEALIQQVTDVLIVF